MTSDLNVPITKNEQYQAYVRRVSFDLTLTAPQCMLLVACYRKMTVEYSHFVPVMRGLNRKGLVTHTAHEYDIIKNGRKITNCTGTFAGDRPAYKLTKEGELTAQLVELSGLPELENLLNMIETDPIETLGGEYA